MFAEIVSIGEELLSSDSETLDTNSVHITKVLGSLGIRVLYKTTVGDDEARITDVLKIALSRADVIITTGGLGPTVDDMTRQSVAATVGVGLDLRQDLLDDIAAKFARFNTRMSDNNRIQAMLPVGALPIHNPAGTAPGFIVEQDGKAILSLPGVPREMKAMMEATVVPYLREKLGAAGVIRTRVIRTAGIGESLIDEQIGHLEKLSNPTVGLNAHSGQTDIRITARTATEAEAAALIAGVEGEIREKLGPHIFGVDKEPLDAAFYAVVRVLGVRVTIAEVGTEDALRARLTKFDPAQAAALLMPVEGEALEQLAAAYRAEPDRRKAAEAMAQALYRERGAGVAIVILSEPEGTAYSVTDGTELRSRSFSVTPQAGGPDWGSGWSLSIAWYLLSRMRAGSR